MQIVQQIAEIPRTDRPVVLAMGCFDGVHLGHRKVIATAVEQAAALSGEAWVFTFHPHPAKVLSPRTAPALISTEACRLRQFAALGVYGTIVVPFDRTFAHLEPGAFLAALRDAVPSLRGIVCGTDWSFGYRAQGHFQTLEKACARHGIRAIAVEPILYDENKISSTHIRQAVRDGDLPLAEQMLGRPFSLFGTVVQGRGVGRALGFPTANLAPLNELLPAPGVYAAGARLADTDADRPCAVFIGERKTFQDSDPTVEAYLFDFSGDLYGQPLELRLMRKIRPVCAFPSREALIAQIGRDVADIRALLARR
jgi:riboflavin kinase/FMN adenylyltransferase